MLEKLTGTFSGIIKSLSGKSTITEKNIEDTVDEIKMALLEADVNLRVVRRFVNSTVEEAKGEKVLKSVNPGQQFTKIIYDKIVSMLGDEKKNLAIKGPDTTSVILLLGLQGAGKTTAAHKLASRLKKEGRNSENVYLRIDDGFTVDEILNLSEKNKIVLNASTVTEEELEYMKLRNAKFFNMLSLHNFYPKRFTGISKKYLLEQILIK